MKRKSFEQDDGLVKIIPINFENKWGSVNI